MPGLAGMLSRPLAAVATPVTKISAATATPKTGKAGGALAPATTPVSEAVRVARATVRTATHVPRSVTHVVRSVARVVRKDTGLRPPPAGSSLVPSNLPDLGKLLSPLGDCPVTGSLTRPVAHLIRPVADLGSPVVDTVRPVADLARPVTTVAAPAVPALASPVLAVPSARTVSVRATRVPARVTALPGGGPATPAGNQPAGILGGRIAAPIQRAVVAARPAAPVADLPSVTAVPALDGATHPAGARTVAPALTRRAPGNAPVLPDPGLVNSGNSAGSSTSQHDGGAGAIVAGLHTAAPLAPRARAATVDSGAPLARAEDLAPVPD
ncbi:MAG: hypothetical protein JWO79_4200 [Actinomycetia bacterium]|nr:hypothetical protein [Actinomycetes bacterium]